MINFFLRLAEQYVTLTQTVGARAHVYHTVASYLRRVSRTLFVTFSSVNDLSTLMLYISTVLNKFFR
jgi:hypothetical protein